MITAFPLAWPQGWPRTPDHRRVSNHPFGGRTYPLTFDRARRQLLDELARLGAKNIVLSTNIPLRQDGQPYAGAADRGMDDPGVAVYFRLKDRDLSMARDGFTNIAANMRSLFLAVDGLRQLERHGGSYMMDRAFSGFIALPPPGPVKRSWWEVLGFPKGRSNIQRSDIESAFRRLAQERHPDSGGSHDAMSELNAARAQALKEIGA
jgi:hypothetical protein